MRTVQKSQSWARKSAFFAGVGSCLAFLIGWQLNAEPSAAQTAHGTVHPLRNPLVDEDDNPIPRSDLDTELWSTNQEPHFQVLTPAGDPITLGEWLEVGGTGQITKTPEGTEVQLELTGLVPNGVYTAWGFFFQDPPYNFSEVGNFPDNVAAGAIGLNDGSESRFDADENGMATFEAIIPPGALSLQGEAPAYVLDGYSSFAIGAIYHNDGMTYGPVQGPNHVAHFAVGFVPEPSSLAILCIAGCGLAGAVAFRQHKKSLKIE